jgi:hypothetical protein
MTEPAEPQQETSLSSEEKIDAAYQVARQELSPEHIAVLRGLGEGVRLHQAFGLWRMAREALCRQAMERGLGYEEAMREAAQRMLSMSHDSAA